MTLISVLTAISKVDGLVLGLLATASTALPQYSEALSIAGIVVGGIGTIASGILHAIQPAAVSK